AGRIWVCAGSAWTSDGIRIWDETGESQELHVISAGTLDSSWAAIGCSPEGDIYARNLPGLQCYRMNPNVVALLNGGEFAAGDSFTLKYWAENPGGASRELDLYMLITLPTGDSVYLPTLYFEPVPVETLTIPKETTLSPVELLTLQLPDDLPPGEYRITPWFCDHGSAEQTGQCTSVTFMIE
ncbi:MAG: hypothetical protein JW941_13465, partial [Candidatus Coatesbacteria bacterium]|nr:hypothetical protein [Candidatus Coatesbacteria bacterium]